MIVNLLYVTNKHVFLFLVGQLPSCPFLLRAC